MPKVRKVHAWVVAVVLLVSAGAAYAQFDRGFRGDGNAAPRFPPALRKDRAFSFCRILYTSVRREFGGPQPLRVLVRTDLEPTHRYEPLDLPCFTRAAASPAARHAGSP